MKRTPLALLVLALRIGSVPAAQNEVELEGGYVTPASIDVAIPGDSGTRFSMTDDLSADSPATARIRFGRVFARNHWVGVLLAPLTVEAEGAMDRTVSFNGVDFPAGTPVEAKYRFDSYRVSYRYLFRSADRWQFRVGGSLKVRDAAISMEGGSQRTEKDNTGLVPLLSFQARWSPAASWSLLLDGEGLASPQGRAEDVLLAVQREFGQRVSLYAGYRLLEGGADNDEVYTFALFHSVVAGAVFRF